MPKGRECGVNCLQATDLGIVSHLHGLKSGKRRLRNLVHVKSTIDVAGHLVIWPFWSRIYSTTLGFEHFECLRTKLTEVSMRRPKSGASPWISSNVLVSEMQDPEEYYHTQVLRNTRRYLRRA